MAEDTQTNPFDAFDEDTQTNPFDAFDEDNTATEEELPELTPKQQELAQYADEMQSRGQVYEEADFEAAGYTPEDISAFNAYVESQRTGEPAGDGTTTEGWNPTYSTDYSRYDTFGEAFEFYNNIILKDPNVTPPPMGIGYAMHTNPDTGETNYLTPPTPTLFGQGAKSSSFDLAAVGLANALGNAVELVGAGVEYAGVEGATEFADNLLPGVDTGTSALDALIVEGVPMLVAGGGAGNAVYQTLKAAPQILRASAALIAGETVIAAGSDNEAATIAIGDNAMFPMLRGIDLGDSEAETVIEARMNILIDGLMAGGVVSAAGSAALQVGKFANELFVSPILDVTYRVETAAERRMYEAIVDALVGVDKAVLSDPQRLFEARDTVAQIIADNKDVAITRLTDIDETYQITLDTMAALERGLREGADESAMVAQAQGLRLAEMNANSPLTPAAVRRPMSVLDRETGELLRETGGETAQDQTARMADAADDLAQQGRDEVVAVGARADTATAAYQQSASELVADIANDIELSDEVSRLAAAVGTDIDTSRVASRNQIVQQIETGYEALTRQKNELYGAIQGGDIEVSGLIDLLDDLPTEQITQATANTRNSSPVRGLLSVTKRQTVTDETADAMGDAAGATTRPETDEERISRVEDYLSDNGIDFGVFYREIRPELSQIAQDAYGSRTAAGVASGRNFRDIVSYIDNDMLNYVIRSGDADVADAAKAANDFYQGTYAPLFRDGKLQEYAELHSRTIGRTRATSTYSPQDLGYRESNPGGDWLQGKQTAALRLSGEGESALSTNLLTGSQTASFGKTSEMYIETDMVSGLPGANSEIVGPGNRKYDELLQQVQATGFDPDQAGNSILIGVNQNGDAFIMEGNNRVAIASEFSVPKIRAEVVYFNGGELANGTFSPTAVAQRGTPTLENTGTGSAPRIGEVSYRTETRNMLDSTMREGSPAQIDQFKQLLSMSDAGANPEPIAEYMVADTIAQAYDSLRASGGTDAQLGGYIGQLRQYSEALNEVFPERASELNTFIRSIEDARGNRDLLQQRMEDAQANVQETLQRVQNGELRFFFRQEFGDIDNPLLRNMATTSNPQQSFRSLMLSNETDRIAAMEAIMQRVSQINDPERQKVVSDGIETAYLRLFRDQTLSTRTELGGNRAVLPTRIERSADEMNALYQMGDEIYADTPEIMQAVRETSELASTLAKSRNAVPVSSMSATAFNQQAATATSRLIYLTVGPLSKAGTRIRSVLGTAIEGADGYAKAANIRDQILADPNEFLRLSRMYNRQPNDEALQSMLLRFMFQAGVRATDPATNTQEDTEMNMMFPE